MLSAADVTIALSDLNFARYTELHDRPVNCHASHALMLLISYSHMHAFRALVVHCNESLLVGMGLPRPHGACVHICMSHVECVHIM